MTPADFYATILKPATLGVSGTLTQPNAMCMMLAIAGRESGWTDRIQEPWGQARGFWQCERAGMLRGVMKGGYAPTLDGMLYRLGLPLDEASLFEAITWNDPLAFVVARLGLFMDPHPMPALGDIEGAWDVYERVWRPGKPSRARWTMIYPQALHVIRT